MWPRRFLSPLFLLLLLNALVKPVWIFFIDRSVQQATGNAYGAYFSLLHFTLVPAALADAGILAYYSRTVAARPEQAAGKFRQFLYIKTILAFLYLLLTLTPFVLAGTGTAPLVAELALLQIAASFYLFFRTHISALQYFTAAAWFSVADKLLVILAAGSLLYLPGTPAISIHLFTSIQLGAFVLAGLAAFRFLQKKNMPATPVSIRLPELITALRPAIPYAIVVLLMTLVYRFDAFLLYRLHPNGETEAAVYAQGFRLLDALNMAGFLVASFLLPYLGNAQRNTKEKQQAIRHSTLLLLVYSLAAAGMGWLYQTELYRLLYKTPAENAVRIMAITICAIVGCSLVQVFGTVLTAAGKTKTLSICAAFAAAANIIANRVFIPQYGAAGTATIAVFTQLLFAGLLLAAVYRHRLFYQEWHG